VVAVLVGHDQRTADRAEVAERQILFHLRAKFVDVFTMPVTLIGDQPTISPSCKDLT
jgi:hypothetical protein